MFLNINEMLPQVKKTEVEILDVVDEFCKKNNFKYSLAYGTLLGAIRHGGFIPWDDDIDLFMPREDYEKFISLWRDDERYLLMTPLKDKEYTQTFIKIRKNNTTYLQDGESHLKYHKGIFIDIFPCDRVAKSKIKKCLQKMYALLMILYARGYAPIESSQLIKLICKVLLKVIPNEKYKKYSNFFENRMVKMSDKNGEYFNSSTLRACSTFFPTNMFDDLKKVSFEGKYYSAVNDYDNILKKIYGNYMNLPPEKDRVWMHHPILIDFEHNCEECENV